MSDGESSRQSVDTIQAPWTDEQVIRLNEYQHSGLGHPFTGENLRGQKVDLIATHQGWIAEEGGAVVQDWAYDFMADGTFSRDGALAKAQASVFSRSPTRGIEI